MVGTLNENSAVTQRVGFTGARLRISRLKPGADLERTLSRVCEIAAHALGVARVGVWLAEHEADRLRCLAMHDEGRSAQPLPTITISQHPAYCTAVLGQRFVSVDDALSDPQTRELKTYLEPLHIRSLLDAALYRDGAVIGVVCHESLEPRRWTADERQFAATVADLAAYFMEASARLDAERRAHALVVSSLERERLEQIGRFATGVAHDLNNLITAAQLNVAFLSREPRRESADSVQELESALAHAQTLARQLMAFQKGGDAPTNVTGAALKAQLEPLLSAFIKAPVVVKYVISEGVSFFANVPQLVQVVVNLVTNARDAMKTGGVVLVRAVACEDEPGFSKLEVIDTGAGISAEHATQLFQPFFTTKGEAGTGLGLSLVHFIVGQHHGTVGIQSTVGDGTTVTIRWPSTEAAFNTGS